MTDEQARRIGRNEALYRHLNEHIEDVNQASSSSDDSFEIVCECGNLECTETMVVSFDVYERTRAHSARFIVKPGHEEPGLAEMVESEDEYLITEKRPAEARRIAEETDPRR